jgi:two-component system, LytTR family, response regulator
MIHCLVVDDEQHALDLIVRHINQVPFLTLAGACTNPVEAIHTLQHQHVDLIFLDIHMSGMSGFDFIKNIPQKYRVVLTTAYSEFALDGFEHNVVDYLVKPVSFSRFMRSAQRVHELITTKGGPTYENSAADNYFFVKTECKGKMIKVNYDSIDFIEGRKNYVAIHHNQEKILALLNMKYLEDLLPKDRFIRVHHSFIIAKEQITMIEGNQVALKNTTERIPIGVTYKDHFLQAMKIKK